MLGSSGPDGSPRASSWKRRAWRSTGSRRPRCRSATSSASADRSGQCGLGRRPVGPTAPGVRSPRPPAASATLDPMSTPIQAERLVATRDAAETRLLGARLAATARPGDLLCLIGDLGAGKTQVAKGFAVGLGVTDTVSSPTFVLMAEYAGRLPLFHLDLYRLADAADALAGGLLDERQLEGVVLIEWAERLGDALPAARLDVVITGTGDEPRSIALRDGRSGLCALPRGRRVMRRRAAARHRHGDDAGGHRPRRGRMARSIDARSWTAGYRHGEELLARIEQLLAGRRACPGGPGRRSSSAPAPARSPGSGSASRRPRGSPTRSGCPSRAYRPVAPCCRRPRPVRTGAGGVRPSRPRPAGRDRRTVSSAGLATPSIILPGGEEPDLRDDEMLVAVDLAGRAPDEARRARRGRLRRGWPPRCSAIGRGPARRGTATISRGWCRST